MNKFSIRISLFLFCLLSCMDRLQAQEVYLRPRTFIEAYGGGSKYFGEFTDISFWLSGGINVWYRYNPNLYFGGSLAIAQTRFRVVNDAQDYFSAPQILGRVTPVDGLIRWNLLPFESGSPYLTLGAGWMSFEVHEDDGQYATFYLVNTDTKERRTHPLDKTSLKSTFEYNLGLGYEHIISKRFSLGAYTRMYFPFTDLLDAVEYIGSSNDAFMLFGITASIGVSSLTGMADTDGDDVPDQTEEALGMNVSSPDSDGDGLGDFDELAQHTNPLEADTDGDGLNDYIEINSYKSSPLLRDTDADGLSDNEEATRSTNPLNPDSDGDQLTDGAEVALGTDPLIPTELSDELLLATESKAIGKENYRVIKPMLSEFRALKTQLGQTQEMLKIKTAEAEKKPQQAVTKGRTAAQPSMALAELQRRYDSLQREISLLTKNADTRVVSTDQSSVRDERDIRDSLENRIALLQSTIAALRTEASAKTAVHPREVFVRDTVIRIKRDTVYSTLRDTVRLVRRDTVHNLRHDTLFVQRRDTVRLGGRDTVVMERRDTVFVERRDTVILSSGEGSASMRRDSFALLAYQFDPSPIYFPFGGAEITVEGENTIGLIADFMRKYPESILEISGYADLDGTLEQNKVMSQKRTGAVAQRLEEKGIEAWRLILRAYGSILATKSDQKDRRVEFKLVKLVRF